MKVVLLAACLIIAVVAEDKYKEIGDIDITEVLNSDRLLTSYAKCLISKGPCTPEVRQVKEKLPEALATRCAKCTDRQKQMAKQLIQEVKNKRPDLWKELVAKYDPNGQHQQAFKDFLS